MLICKIDAINDAVERDPLNVEKLSSEVASGSSAEDSKLLLIPNGVVELDVVL